MTRRRRVIVAATIAVAILVGAAAGLIAARGGGGGSSGSEPGTGARETPGSKAAQSFGPPDEDGAPADTGRDTTAGTTRLEPLIRGRPGAGSARLVGRGAGARLELRVSGLPALEEEYAVWLYNSVTDARRLAGVVAPRFTVTRALPADPAGYGYLDVSREPFDGNPNHSGDSVLRVPVASLLRAETP